MEINNKKYNQETTQTLVASTNQDIADNTADLNVDTFGSTDRISFEEITIAGFYTTDPCISVSLNFQGTGGTLNGITVQDGFIISFSASLRNVLNGIDYTIPTAPDSSGNQRVLLGYTKK